MVSPHPNSFKPFSARGGSQSRVSGDTVLLEQQKFEATTYDPSCDTGTGRGWLLMDRASDKKKKERREKEKEKKRDSLTLLPG